MLLASNVGPCGWLYVTLLASQSKTQVAQNLFPTEGSLDNRKGHILV